MTFEQLRVTLERRINILEAAKAWASQGYLVAPIRSDKTPVSFTCRYASTPEDVEELYKRECEHGFEGFTIYTKDNSLVLDLDMHGAEDCVEVFEAYCREHNNTPKPHIEDIPHDEHFRRPEDCPMNVKTGASWAETH